MAETSIFFDMDGKPIDAGEFRRLFAGKERLLKQEMVGDYWVSTVWLGLDHGFRPDPAAPLIFETMVFDAKPTKIAGGSSDRFCARYATRKHALDGHVKVVGAIQRGIKPEDIEL